MVKYVRENSEIVRQILKEAFEEKKKIFLISVDGKYNRYYKGSILALDDGFLKLCDKEGNIQGISIFSIMRISVIQGNDEK